MLSVLWPTILMAVELGAPARSRLLTAILQKSWAARKPAFGSDPIRRTRLLQATRAASVRLGVKVADNWASHLFTMSHSRARQGPEIPCLAGALAPQGRAHSRDALCALDIELREE